MKNRNLDGANIVRCGETQYRGFLLARHKIKKIWYLTAKPFFYYDFPDDLTGKTRKELVALIDKTLIRLKYLLEGQ